MVRHDCEDDLICDFAEYYNIYDYEKLPPSYTAVLLYGLPPKSRVKMHYSKQPADNELMLLANIADSLNFIAWSKTKDAEKNKNRPASIVEALYGVTKKEELTTYNTPDDFKAARQKILERLNNGNAIR